MQDWQELTDQIGAGCAAAGLDLVQPLQVGWYNAAVAPAHCLPDGGEPTSLAVLVANTRALWPRFLAALQADATLGAAADPLDRYTERAVTAAAAGLAAVREIRFAHEPPPRRVAMQRLAHAAGLAFLSPTHLSVHPLYGPWIGLRAMLVADVAGPTGAPVLADPCADCRARCVPLLDRAVIGGAWRSWLAVRDACTVGRAHRYDDDQIEYHYTWSRAVLERALSHAGDR